MVLQHGARGDTAGHPVTDGRPSLAAGLKGKDPISTQRLGTQAPSGQMLSMWGAEPRLTLRSENKKAQVRARAERLCPPPPLLSS